MAKKVDIKNVPADKFQVMTPLFKGSNRKNLKTKVDTIVVHWSGGRNIHSDITTLFGNNTGYHFLIKKDGTVIQTARLEQKVGHAGVSYGPNGKWVNGYSIGISFGEFGYGDDTKFNNDQTVSLSNLIKDLKVALPNLKWITGHNEITMNRKPDPWSFDFKSFNNDFLKGLGMKLWFAGMSPYPDGLKDCECIETAESDKEWCIKAKGGCIGPGNRGYLPQNTTRTEKEAASHEMNPAAADIDSDEKDNEKDI